MNTERSKHIQSSCCEISQRTQRKRLPSVWSLRSFAANLVDGILNRRGTKHAEKENHLLSLRSFAANRKRHLFFLAAGATAITGQVQAIEPKEIFAYSLGPVTLRPRLTISEQYNDNILYRPSNFNPESDFVSTFSPGVTVTLGHQGIQNPWLDLGDTSEENYVSASYNMDSNVYASHGDLNNTDHTLDLTSRIKGYRLSLQGADHLQLLSGVLGGAFGLGENVNRTVYNDNYTLSYSLTEKTKAYVNGSYVATDYAQDTPLLDYNTVKGTLGFDFAAFSKTSFFGELYYGQSAVVPNGLLLRDGPHEDFLGGFVGARGEFTQRLKGSIKVGYETRDFSDNTPAGSSPVVEATLNYRFREKSTITLTYARNTSVSPQSAGVSFVGDNLGLRIDQRFGASGKWTATLGASYLMTDYGSSGFYANRKDDWLITSLYVTYLFRLWLNASLGYEYEKFSSNASYLGIPTYDANRVTLRITLGY